MIIKRCIPMIALWVILLHAVAFAGQGTLSGVVVDKGTGKPLAGVSVWVRDTALIATTKEDGSYSISMVPEGTYTIVASKVGYVSGVQHGVKVVPDQETQLDFQLTPGVFELEKVVVTAVPVERSIKDLSATVSVVEQKDIEGSSAANAIDLLTALPGVFVNKQEAFGRSDIYIRGVGQNGRRLMVLIDGRPVKMGIFGCTVTHSLPLDNVERIEVVRGPSSVLYGSDAMGGVINIITKEARRPAEADFTTSYGTYSTQRYLLRYGGRRGPTNWYLTAGRRSSDGHRPNGQYESWDYTGQFRYALTDYIRMSLLGTYFQGEKREPGPLSAPTPNAWDDYERGAIDLTLNGIWRESEWTLKLYRNFGEHKFSDTSHYKDFTLGGSLWITGKPLANTLLTGGMDFRQQGGEQLTVLPFAKKGKWDKTEYALFAQGEHTLFGRLVLSAGTRFNHDTISGDEWIPHIGVVAHATETTTLRTAVNKGFRSPQLNELYVLTPSNTNLEPERVWNYEVGLNQRVGERLSMDVALYKMEGDNLIERASNPSPPPSYLFRNIGSFDFWGFELGVRALLKPGLTGVVQYTHLDPGDKTTGRPEHKLDTELSYLRGKFSGHLNGQYVAGLYGSDNHADKLSNYLVVIGKLTYQVIPWVRVFLSVDNLLDEDYQIEKDYPMPGRTLNIGLTAGL